MISKEHWHYIADTKAAAEFAEKKVTELEEDMGSLLEAVYGLCVACKDLSPGLVAHCKGKVRKLQDKYGHAEPANSQS